MRSKLIKLVSIAAVMALAISLSACGKKDETKTSTPIDGAGEGYEFVAKSRSITDFVGTEGYVEKALAKNGKLYVVHNDETGTKTLHVIDLATNEDKTTKLDFKSILPKPEESSYDEMPSNEELPSTEEGEASDEENSDVTEEEGSSVQTFEGENTSLEAGELGGFVDEYNMGETYSYEYGDTGASVNDMHICEDGSILFLTVQWGGNGQDYSVCKMDQSGNLNLLYDAGSLVEPEEYLNYIYLREDGGLYYTKDSLIVRVDKEGKKDGEVEAGNWIYNVFVNKDGECYVTFWSQSDEGTVCKKVDFEQKSLGEALKISANDGRIFQTGEDTFIIAGGDAVTEYNVKTDEKTKLWDWINLDLFNVNNDSFTVNDDGTYSLIAQDYTDTGVKYDYVTVVKQKIDPENARKEIIYGCTYLDWDVRKKISAFNKSQDQYRIRVKQYINMDGDYNENTYNEQYARFKADLAAGTEFDIVSADSTDYVTLKLAQKGAFLDLEDYYKSAASRSDYFENILDIFKVNDKDYFAISKVMLLSMIGNPEVFKGKTTWTPEDLVKLRKEYPDIDFISYGTKENAVSQMVIYSLNSFLDYEKGKCDFCKQEFYDLLNFANTFPKEINDDDYNQYAKMASGDIIVSELYLYDVNELRLCRQLMGEDAVIIGPPNSEGIRSQVIANEMYAISSKTKEKEACYEFLKFLMNESDDEVRGGGYGLPVRKQAFYDMMKKEIEPQTYVNENGETVEVTSNYTVGTVDGQIEVGRPTQKDVDTIEEMLLEAHSTLRIDDKFAEIFMEEVEPFIAGQKTAEETANVLQSRISIYLSENE